MIGILSDKLRGRGILSESVFFAVLMVAISVVVNGESFWTTRGLLFLLIRGPVLVVLWALFQWVVDREPSKVESKLSPLGIFAVRVAGTAVPVAVVAGGAYIVIGHVSWQAVAVGLALGAIGGGCSAFLRVRGW